MAGAAPDGYTLLVSATHHVINPAIRPKLPYNASKDFTNIALLATTPNVLVVNQASPARSVADLLALAKKDPGQVSFGSSGSGQSPHLSAELFKQRAGIQGTHVPYKGAGPALIDVIGGQVDGMFDQTNTALPQITEAKVRALAVTSASRVGQLKDVPTLAETVVPGFEAATWYGIYAPKGTPQPVIDKMQAAYL
ncbi:tripartite tricarboxylate transporter substrate-binding protein, partial [Burkholderia sp. SIMBA_019]|uniref:tripartite tricarboxylate transporter substrate-binding protein n=1 Tax=Burkholderia sp. SIMBA_019 TaxID=3085765 RepID=UPI00397D9DBE